jgi:hypothetical protein
MEAALRDLLRMLDGVRYTVGLGKKQLERMDNARAILARIDGGEK